MQSWMRNVPYVICVHVPSSLRSRRRTAGRWCLGRGVSIQHPRRPGEGQGAERGAGTGPRSRHGHGAGQGVCRRLRTTSICFAGRERIDRPRSACKRWCHGSPGPCNSKDAGGGACRSFRFRHSSSTIWRISIRRSTRVRAGNGTGDGACSGSAKCCRFSIGLSTGERLRWS